MKNYVLFIGGTGARVYRSFLHLCAAGAVQESEVKTMLLDADSSNQAVENCCNLYRSYRFHYDCLKAARGVKQTAVFHCNVQMPVEQAISPIPFKQKNVVRLEDVAEENAESKRAMSWFYSKKERKQLLENGFYAHPNIGCVFFQNFQNEYVQQFLDEVCQNLESGEDVNVVLVGSVFGGTGASGLPSMLKMIQSKCGDNSSLHCCGVLVMPYFEVPEPAQSKDQKGLVIQSKEFYRNTRAALEYYMDHGAFERIYLVGKETLDQVNIKYANGGAAQDNKAHIVEIFAAAAVKDFLEVDRDEKIWSHIISEESVSWMSLGKDLYPIADMLRAQVVLKGKIYPFVRSIPPKSQPLWRHNNQWFTVYDAGAGENRERMKEMERYSMDFLRWLYDVQSEYGLKGRLPASRVELCGALVADFAGTLGLTNVRQESEAESQPMLNRFNDLIDTASNIEYVFDKLVLILSSLGVVQPALAGLGCVGLFIRLCDIAGQKKKRRSSTE